MSSATKITNDPKIQSILHELHTLSKTQESQFDQSHLSTLRTSLANGSTAAQTAYDDHMRDKFVALDEDKAQFVYGLIRASGAATVVEAGTSFGVSTIYLALAVSANATTQRPGKVIATEFEPSKIARARATWADCGEAVASVIELREGDLRETLARDMPDVVDFLLLDIWAPLALPALKLVEPSLRKGAVVVTDNVSANLSGGYDDFLKHIRSGGRYSCFTLPYEGGLEMCIYNGATGEV